MTRLRLRCAVVGLCLAAASAAIGACSTYRDDLDRATAHYNDNQYEAALALFEVLELDTDSLPPKERAQYAYFRGMTHFRLKQKLDSRHWLGVALASEKQQAGSLDPDQVKRATETIEPLNKERYGLAEGTLAEAKACKADEECGKDETCKDGKCAGAGGSTDEATTADTATPAASGSPKAKPGCKSDSDCSPEKTCEKGKCVYR